MLLFPNAKINFGLYVIAKRKDGFHNIESVLWPVPWKDILEVIPAPDNKFCFTQSGIAIDADPENNLVVKAFRLMQERFKIPNVHIHLHKNIPFGAGLGGGSSDAAHTMLALNDLFELNMSKKRMQLLASRLGSDCPFFIDGKPHFVAGTGTLLAETQVDLSGFHIGIVKPDIAISTAEAYRNIQSAPSPNRWEIPSDDPNTWNKNIRNQFEDYVVQQHPQIKAIRDKLYHLNAFYVSLSGSGSAVYGLFQEAPHMQQWFAGMNVWQGQL